MTHRKIFTLGLLLLLAAGAWADDHNPVNPPDPMTLFRLTVAVQPAEAGVVSGGGKYQPGTQVTVSTSANSDYDFVGWTEDGVTVSTSQRFNYTMPNHATRLVAVYSYNPGNPQEPTTPHDYRLFLTTNMEGSCTFNLTSGLRHEADNYVSVRAQDISPGFVFQGWYCNGQRVSDDTSFNFLMPYTDATLTARFVYDPESPGEPGGSTQGNVDNGRLGDVNQDGVVNISDAVLVVNHYLNGTTDELPMRLADVNKDGTINVSDAVEIVNRYLNNQ